MCILGTLLIAVSPGGNSLVCENHSTPPSLVLSYHSLSTTVTNKYENIDLALYWGIYITPERGDPAGRICRHYMSA